MTKPKVLSGIWILTKGTAISVAAMIGLMMGGFLASVLGINRPAMPENFKPEEMAIYKMICGIFFYTFLGCFFSFLRQKKTTTFWLVFFFNFAVVNLLNVIEATYFTTMVLFPYSLFSGLGESLFLALGVAFLFIPKTSGPNLQHEFKEWVSSFKTAPAMPLVISWLSFVIIYYTVGWIIAPIVMPYYQSNSFGLQLPSIPTIIIVQLGRGALLLLFSLPLIALWKKGRLSFFLCFGLLLFYKDVVLGLLGASWLPWLIRIVHGLELTVDSFLLAGVYSWLLVTKKAGDKADNETQIRLIY
ncbi:MAG: hypothetical protein ACM3X9_02850 [Bacillota bacterium]